MNQPLYKTIFHDLLHKISNGELSSGDRLPTEKELSETYGVSRITSKRALTELEQAGLIYRVRGKGSFVQKESTATPSVEPTRRLLFLLPFINDLSVGNFTEGLVPVLQNKGYEVLMTTSDFLLQKKAEDLQKEFDGLIYYATDTDQHLDLLFELSLVQYPVIILDKKIYELPYPTVFSDNRAGGQLATAYLAEQGHQRIAYIFGQNLHPQSVRQRYLGYIQAINQATLTFHTLLDDPEATIDHLLPYLQEHEITGLVCENDLVAIEAMRLIKQQQKNVPEDFSIVGFDNIQAASLIDTPLTTVAQDFLLLGQTAGECLIDWIETGQMPEDQKIPVQLIKRNSVKEKENEH